jgi:AcrR family transcriptional regulator
MFWNSHFGGNPMARSFRKKRVKTPVQRRSKLTVESILQAAAHILVRDGYAKCNTNKIARRAGVAIASLYQYFLDKDAIVAELIERRIAHDLAFVQEKLRGRDLPPPQLIDALITAGIELYSKDPELRTVLEEQIPHTGRLNKIRDARLQYREFLKPHLSVLLKKDGRDPELALFFAVHAFLGVIQAAGAVDTSLLGKKIFVEEMRRLVLSFLHLQEEYGKREVI